MATKTIKLQIAGVDEQLIPALANELGYKTTVQKEEEKEMEFTRADYEDGKVEMPENVQPIDESYFSGDNKDSETIKVKYTEQVEVKNDQTIETFLQEHFAEHYIDKIIRPIVIGIMTAAKRQEIEVKNNELKAEEEAVVTALEDGIQITGELASEESSKEASV